MRGERRAAVVVLASRAFSLGSALAVLAAILQALASGREPLPLLPTALGLAGITLVVTALLRERGTARQSAGLVVLVVAAWAAWGMALPARAPDLLASLTRLLGFGILGEVYLWRALTVARAAPRWRDVRDDALLALGAIALASLAPTADDAALPGLALAVACLGAVALSLARSTEEISLGGGEIRGRSLSSPATGIAFALGILAAVLAFALPSLETLVSAAANAVGPALDDLLFLLFLPLGYLAGALVAFGLWLREHMPLSVLGFQIPQAPFSPEDDAARLHEMEQVRPFVFGAVELVVALVALVVAIALVARLVQDRRALLGEGATLEREGIEAIGLAETLRSLFPKRAIPRRAPADDGTAAGAVRRLYWRLLELAEREGPGWRSAPETPAEHERRLAAAAPRWRAAGPLVRAFEALRYGEREMDPATLEAARAALRQVEASG